MQKENYQKRLLNILSTLKDEKPRLLLHACCAPCSSRVLELLANKFQITIFYYNPNIYPKTEYQRRLDELKKFLVEFPPSIENKFSIVEETYNPEDFFKATNVQNEIELQTEKEKGERCRRCYLFRMTKAFNFAKENNFDYFTTTLSISPFKDSEKINTIGFNLEKNLNESDNLHYLPADFKKNNGFLRSIELSKEFNLYRQDYCGCIFSLKNSHN